MRQINLQSVLRVFLTKRNYEIIVSLKKILETTNSDNKINYKIKS